MSAPRRRVIVINGPNLNLLGRREPEVYGATTLTEIENACIEAGANAGLEVTCCQSNDEGQIVTWIQEATAQADALVINAGAYTHSSIAIYDAVVAFDGYTVEFHITNPYRREAFRHRSYLSAAADAVVSGLGSAGYAHVIGILADILGSRTQEAG